MFAFTIILAKIQRHASSLPYYVHLDMSFVRQDFVICKIDEFLGIEKF